MAYKIERPPVTKNFYLPSRDELLILEKGDLVKLIFNSDDEMPERMWVILESVEDDMEWIGIVDNDASGEKLANLVPAGTQIRFHPLDII